VRLAHQTNVHPLARVFHVIQQHARVPSIGFGFLVSGDRQHNRSVGADVSRTKVDGPRAVEAATTGFHIGGARRT